MVRIDEDNKFIEEDALWLPLDWAILAVRKCLHDMIAALSVATDYLAGRSNDAPAESMSHRFAIVHTRECRAFEELCDCVKSYDPGTIPDSKFKDVLHLVRILASRTEEVLPTDDNSSYVLRCAIDKLSRIVCNTRVATPKASFIADVESTCNDICKGFQSLSLGFRKLERKRERGEDPSNGVLNETDKAYIASVGKEVSATVEAAADGLNERADIQADRIKGVEHEVKRARKGQIINCKGFSKDRQEAAFNYWVAARAEYGAKHISDDGFTFYARSLKDIGIEAPEVWHTVVEQWRCKKHLSITKAVKAYNKEQTKTTVRK